MPLDDHRRDDAGRPIDPERYQRLLEREYAEREREEFRIERYTVPENPDIIAFRVLDRDGKLRGFSGFEFAAMEWELPDRILARVKRGATIRSPLRLVG